MQKISRYKVAFLTALIPLVIALVVSCSSAPKKVELTHETTQHWNAQVEETIKDPERATKLKQLGQQLIDVSSSIQQDIEVLNQQAMALHENHDATHEELQQLVGKFSEKRNPKFAEYRDIIFAMRSEVNAEEWKALTD
jgi:FtsZ-binding cell division protein ZapB